MCKFSLTTPIHVLLEKSLESGVFPDKWKLSYVVPVFKSGDKHNITNYRPISLPSVISKIFDCIITEMSSWDLRQHIMADQHGFLPHKSTITNLIMYENYIHDALEKFMSVTSVYTDFSKAFDKVCIKLLLAKLECFGLPDNVLRWFGSFLSGRTQKVRINNVLSSTILVTSGVPQGSHCGPWLFLAYINDVQTSLKFCNILAFADDFKIFHTINSSDDISKFQNDLNSFCDWCESNAMILNVDKCNSITLCYI